MMQATTRRERILVIKLAALGDFVQAFAPFEAIRRWHADAEITLLTTPPFAALAEASPWFDHVWPDGRPDWTDLPGIARLAFRLARGGFKRVYDLQTSSRSSRYRLFVGPRVEWSGIARGASHRDTDPRRNLLHTLERQRAQLAGAGITSFPKPSLDWLMAAPPPFELPSNFALLLPGASPARPGKRWPAERYGELAALLPMQAVICGTAAERELARVIQRTCSSAIDVTGRTDLVQLAAVARRAALTIGNDSGPTHLAAVAGSPTICLFGPESDPALCAPRGPNVTLLSSERLAELAVAEVVRALRLETLGPAARP